MKIMVIDGNSILNRAFYGITLLTNKKGVHTNAIYGFLTTYFKLLNEEKPDKTIVCFDVRAKTFRHEEFADYKGTRKGMPEELAEQVPIIKDVLDALGVDRYELEGYEADDLIGTISEHCNVSLDNCVIVTGDKDSLQLATNLTTINLVSTRMGKTTTKKYDFDAFLEEYGFEPKILTDLKGLMGDKSDNIPGVAGVGEVTAMKLLHSFKNIEGIYENIENPEIKKGVREKLLKDEENAYKSRYLATIIKDVPFEFDINRESHMDNDKLLDLLEDLELKKIIKHIDLQRIGETTKTPKIEVIKPQTKIFEKGQKLSNTLYIYGDLEDLYILSDDICYILSQENKDFNECLEDIFSKKYKKIMHGAKDILVELFYKGIEPFEIIFDTALAMYLLDPSRSEYSLVDMSEEFLGFVPAVKEKELSLFNEKTDDDEICVNTVILKHLHGILNENLGEMSSLYYDIELPLMTVLADMQVCGVSIDKDLLISYGEKLNTRILELTESIYSSANKEFNINSPKQLGEVLFEDLGLKALKKTKTGYSTNVDVLLALKDKHEIVPYILEYRTLSKLHSTYVEGLLKVIKNDGKIHSTFNQMVTTTGRLSSTDPNLQNIPVRTEIGQEMRKMFVVSSKENTLIDADYSQIELRILADIANDDVMLNAFKSGTDIHTVTASQVFDVDIKDVTSIMRSRAKAVNFGIVYGISAFSLAGDIDVTVAEAKKYMENYLEKYKGVSSYMDNVKKKAYEDGYVLTLFNRKRELPELKSSNFNTRSFGERVALNTPIQGTAADIIKIAMVNVYNRLKSEKLKTKLILQIHDELILEAPLEEKELSAKILKEEMQNAFSGKVSLTVDCNFGKNWYDAK